MLPTAQQLGIKTSVITAVVLIFAGSLALATLLTLNTPSPPTCSIQGPTELLPGEEMQSSQGKSLKVYSNIYTQGGGTFNSLWLNNSNYNPIRLDAQGTFIPNGSWPLPQGENILAVEWDNVAHKKAGDKPSKVIVTITDAQGRTGTCSHIINLKSVSSGANLPIADSDMGGTRFDNGYIIFGWAFDPDKESNTPVRYDVYVDGQRKASNKTANEYRPDVRMNRNDVSTDNHGWSYMFASPLTPGTYHQIRLDFYDIDSSGSRTGDKTTITKEIYVPTTSYPVGYFDGNALNPDKIEGWAWDPNDTNQQLDIQIYADGTIMTGTLIAETKADTARNIPGYPAIGRHGFSIDIPASIKDGNQHTLEAYVKDYTGRPFNSWIKLKGQMTYQGTVTPPSPRNEKCTTILTNKFCGEYYDYYKLTRFKFSRLDDKIDFDWGAGSPDKSIGANTFSVRWIGKFDFSGKTRFAASADDGIRVWVDSDLIIDEWQRQEATTYTATRDITGQHTIKVEYYEYSSNALARLVWASPGDLNPQGNAITGGSTPPVAASDLGENSPFNNSSVIFGWAFDPDKESQALQFDLFVDGNKVTLSRKTANTYRPDVPMNRDDVQSEYHGWEYIMMPHPAVGEHEVTVRFYDIDSNGSQTGGEYDLKINLNIKPSSDPVGYFDGNTLNPDKIEGWAWDPDNPYQPLRVEIWADGDRSTGRRIAYDSSAREPRDIPGSKFITNRHGFSLSIPNSIKDGEQHVLHAYARNYKRSSRDPDVYVKLPGEMCYPNDCVPPEPPPPAPHVDNVFAASYYHYVRGSGEVPDDKPDIVRQEKEINHDWGYGVPSGMSQYSKDSFAARWEGTFDFFGETYFIASHDDGMRAWIDDELIYNKWFDQAATTRTFTKNITGIHAVKVEYYERGNAASAKFLWDSNRPAVLPPNVSPQNVPSCINGPRNVTFNVSWAGFPNPNWGYKVKVGTITKFIQTKVVGFNTQTTLTVNGVRPEMELHFYVDNGTLDLSKYTKWTAPNACQNQPPSNPRPTGTLNAAVLAAVPVIGDQIWYQGGIINGSRVNGALVAPNCSYPTAVKVRNTGTRPWRAQDGIHLKNTGDNFFQERAIGLNPGVTVNPGETYTFYFRVTTPRNPTHYPSSRPNHGKWIWKMADERGRTFGQEANWKLAPQRFGNKYGRYQAAAEIPCIQPPQPPHDSIHVLKVFMGLNMQDANQKTEVWLDNHFDKHDNNPMIFKNVNAGQHTVHMENPGGVKIYYSVCRNRTLCLSEFREGTTATVNLPAGQYVNVTYIIGRLGSKIERQIIPFAYQPEIPVFGPRFINIFSHTCSTNVGIIESPFWNNETLSSLKNAINAWNNKTNYRFNYIGPVSSDHDDTIISVRWVSGDQLINTTVIPPTSLNAVEAAAIAAPWFYIYTDGIETALRTEIMLNADFSYFTNDNNNATSMHLPSLIKHELGHALGLRHVPYEENSIMQNGLAYGEILTINRRDIDTINNYLYPWCR